MQDQDRPIIPEQVTASEIATGDIVWTPRRGWETVTSSGHETTGQRYFSTENYDFHADERPMIRQARTNRSPRMKYRERYGRGGIHKGHPPDYERCAAVVHNERGGMMYVTPGHQCTRKAKHDPDPETGNPTACWQHSASRPY